jgi:hypothetical protein
MVVRRGRSDLPEIADAALRDKLYALAAAGVSRRGMCAVVGIELEQLRDWLARGRAQKNRWPYNEFAQKFLLAERAQEVIGSEVLSTQLAHVKAKHPRERTHQEISFVASQMARQFPKDHGAGDGLAALREPEPDIDLNAWWAKTGLDREQLQALLREPPETLREAIIAEAATVFGLLVAAGWKPPKGKKSKREP